jgi:predicted ester cyclase
MSVEDNKELTRRLYDEMNNNNVDALNDLLAADYREEFEIGAAPLTRDAAIAMTRVLHSVVPGLRRSVEWQVAEGDVVVDCVTYTGTSVAEFRGIPAGTTLTFKSVLRYRMAGGRIAETWSIRDRLQMYEQAGIAPPAAAVSP